MNTLSHGPEELDVTPNFLGQTPLHLAIALGNTELTRALVDAGHPLDIMDCNCRTPLDYTALLGNTSCAKILLLAWAGIDRSSQEIMLTVGNPTFLTFALFPYKRNFVFEVLQYIQETFRDDKDRFISSASANRVLGDMAYHGNRYNDNTQALLPFTCDDISRMIDMVDDVNSEFSSENGSVRFRLLELYWPLEHAQHIIRRGYRGPDSKVVATAASVGDLALVKYYLELNVLIDNSSCAGTLIILNALRRWSRSCPSILGRHERANYPGTIKLLLQAGVDITGVIGKQQRPRLNMNFPYDSPLQMDFRTDKEHGPFLAIEWLNMLHELGRKGDARTSLVAFIQHFEDRMDHVEDFELDDLRSTWLGHISKFYEGYLAMYGLPCSKDVLSAYACEPILPNVSYCIISLQLRYSHHCWTWPNAN